LPAPVGTTPDRAVAARGDQIAAVSRGLAREQVGVFGRFRHQDLRVETGARGERPQDRREVAMRHSSRNGIQHDRPGHGPEAIRSGRCELSVETGREHRRTG